MGITDVTMDYYSPGVKGQVIWGELVTYYQSWRTGANKATTISFSSEVTNDSNKFAEGKYALLTIPTVEERTMIFSKQINILGSDGLQTGRGCAADKSEAPTRRIYRANDVLF